MLRSKALAPHMGEPDRRGTQSRPRRSQDSGTVIAISTDREAHSWQASPRDSLAALGRNEWHT